MLHEVQEHFLWLDKEILFTPATFWLDFFWSMLHLLSPRNVDNIQVANNKLYHYHIYNCRLYLDSDISYDNCLRRPFLDLFLMSDAWSSCWNLPLMLRWSQNLNKSRILFDFLSSEIFIFSTWSWWLIRINLQLSPSEEKSIINLYNLYFYFRNIPSSYSIRISIRWVL